jgi:hypothetical protein
MEEVWKLDEGFVLALAGMAVGVVAILGGITVAITKVVSAHYRRSQLDEMEATLKMEMIQRGMAGDEIAKVLGARMSANKSTLGEIFANWPQYRGAAAFKAKCKKT